MRALNPPAATLEAAYDALLGIRPRRIALAEPVTFAYMPFNSGASGSGPHAPPEYDNGPRARFFVPEPQPARQMEI